MKSLPRDALSHRWIHRQCKWTFVRWKKRFLHVYISAPRETLETPFCKPRWTLKLFKLHSLVLNALTPIKTDFSKLWTFTRTATIHFLSKEFSFRAARLISSSISQPFRFGLFVNDANYILAFFFFLGYFENVCKKNSSSIQQHEYTSATRNSDELILLNFRDPYC